jgi:flagellar M-ring protein FliF
MRRLEELAKAAVGFDSKRGDQVVVENVSFSSNAPEPKPPVVEQVTEGVRSLLRSQPGLPRTLIAGICAVLLVMFILRPMVRQLTATLQSTTATNEVSSDEPTLPHDQWEQEPQPQPLLKSRAQLRHQSIFDQVAEHIRREPAQSTRLLEAWIGSSEETD